MKYQNFAIIFVIIVLPISIVLSFYIQSQTDTITLQSKYQTKLNDSVYDAVSSFQINTLNTSRVTGESVKSYVLASVNTFFTTLATNLGMSGAAKSRLQVYVPAVLFTTYDGYYIYSPLKAPEPALDGDGMTSLSTEKLIQYKKDSGSGVTTNPDEADIAYNYMLKPFIYYSGEYVQETAGTTHYDVIASYTLDNYVTLYGEKQPSYHRADSGSYVTPEFSKSGYLIDPSKVTIEGSFLLKTVARDAHNISSTEPSEAGVSSIQAIIDANKNPDVLTHDNVRYQVLNFNSADPTIPPIYNYINYIQYGESYAGSAFNPPNNDKTYSPFQRNSAEGVIRELRYQTGDQIIETTLQLEKDYSTNADFQYLIMGNVSNYSPLKVTYHADGQDIIIDDYDAKEYYIKAYFLSLWVQRNLADIEAGTIKQTYEDPSTHTIPDEYIDFEDDTAQMFNIGTDNNPESEDSIFAQHKRNLIKNSIQYNLNSAISTYNDHYFSSNYDYLLPVLKQSDWEAILNNVTMVAFLQGMPCGTSLFNNYAVVKSNNNNNYVNVETLYFADRINHGTAAENTGETYSYHRYDCPELVSSSDIYDSDISAEFMYDAKRVNTKVLNDSYEIVCAYDDSTNTYYNIDFFDPSGSKENIENVHVRSNDPIVDIEHFPYGGGELNLTELPNGPEVLYLYDHRNLGCYTCITGGNYVPVIKYLHNEIYKVYQTGNFEILIKKGTRWYYEETDEQYTGPTPPDAEVITDAELAKRKKSIYTALAKYKNRLYKTNDYVNR